MSIDTLKTAWNASIAQPVPGDRLDRLARDVRQRVRRYHRAAVSRVLYGSAMFALALALLGTLATVPDVWPGMRIAMGVWSAGMIACVIGLWRVLAGRYVDPDATLATHLQACLRQVNREIGYQRSLRWLWWVPFGIGLLAAGLGRVSVTPGISWLFVLVGIVFWIHGFIHAPQRWPQRLQREADVLQNLLDGLRTDAGITSSPGGAT